MKQSCSMEKERYGISDEFSFFFDFSRVGNFLESLSMQGHADGVSWFPNSRQ